MPPKIKWKYSKGYVTRVLNSIPSSQLRTMKECVKVGYSIYQLEKEFKLPESWAVVVYQKYGLPDRSQYKVLGNKAEPYYETEEDMTIPEYKLEDLQGEEKYLAKKRLPNSWKWEK